MSGVAFHSRVELSMSVKRIVTFCEAFFGAAAWFAESTGVRYKQTQTMSIEPNTTKCV